MKSEEQAGVAAIETERMATLGVLAAGIAHEINNPLSYVLHNVESLAVQVPRLWRALGLLASALGDERSAEVLGPLTSLLEVAARETTLAQAEDALDGIHRLRDTVRDLRTFARADDEQRLPVNVNDVLETVLGMARGELRYRATVVKDFGVLPAVWSNDGKLAHLFLHLLMHVARSIEEGDAGTQKLLLRSWHADGVVFVELGDTAALSPEALGQLFEPFTGPPQSNRSGLGLAICQRIATALGGALEAFGVDGGTRFRVRLPSGRQLEAAQPDPSGAPRRVLVVDDEPHIGRAIRQMLGKGYEVEACTSGSEAQRLLAGGAEYDVLLCDLMMPEITGMDLLDWLSTARPELLGRVILITGGAFTPKARAFMERSPLPRLEKPFTVRRLRVSVQRLLAGEEQEPT